MPANDPNLQRRINPFNAWFVQLDEEKRSLLKSARLRLLLLSLSLLALLSLNLLGATFPDHPLSMRLLQLAPWLHGLEIALLLLLVWGIWRELLRPLHDAEPVARYRGPVTETY
jgi:hypothetical protein